MQGDGPGMLLMRRLASNETLHFGTKSVGTSGMAVVESPALASGEAAKIREGKASKSNRWEGQSHLPAKLSCRTSQIDPDRT